MSDETTDTSLVEKLKEGLDKVLDNLAKARLERDGVLVVRRKGKTITVRAKDLK